MKKTNRNSNQRRGFVLIATISLLILLAVLAVGMLSLSAASLRSSSNENAQAEARTNARMALMIALGELQKTMGPDRAVTASSEIRERGGVPVSKPRLTGVWESWWDMNPTAGPLDYDGQKRNRFKGWLVSGAKSDVSMLEFVDQPWSGQTVELVGNASMGGNAADADRVLAGLVPISNNGNISGNYAWHVADESVKARINHYRNPEPSQTLAQKRALLAGHRPNVWNIKAPSGSNLAWLPEDQTPAAFANAMQSTGKAISLDQAELLDADNVPKIKPLRHDITPYSLGVMTDVRNGGLKQDLSSIFEMGSANANNLPNDFTGKKLYASTHGISGISDPNWSALAGYYNSYRNLSNADTAPSYVVKSNSDNTLPVPTGYNPMPVIAKVDTVYSLILRPIQDVWWMGWAMSISDYRFMVNLIYTPIVTLHNPYNVNLSFHSLKVTFENMPIGFNFMYSDDGNEPFVSQSIDRGKFETANLYAGNCSHKYSMNIANWSDTEKLSTSSSTTGPVVMRPGQTLVCGPRFRPDKGFSMEHGHYDNDGFDWQSSVRVSESIKAMPGVVDGLGFESYGIAFGNWFLGRRDPTGLPTIFMRDNTAPNPPPGQRTDRLYVEFQAQQPALRTNDTDPPSVLVNPTFVVTAEIQGDSSSTPTEFAKLEFNYTDDSTVKSHFNNRIYRYPATGSFSARDFVPAPAATKYADQGPYVHPFAIFSASARTTSGGVYETGQRTELSINSPEVNLLKDGRLAGIPTLFHNPTRSKSTFQLEKRGTPDVPTLSVQSYELNLQPFLSKGDYQDYMDVDASNRVPSLSGNKTTSGIKSGSYLEVPSGPLMTISDFRRSNALTTAFLPHFVQPVANSRLHPLMSPDKVVESNASVSNIELLDHSFLANHALYDRFYFSTFASRGSQLPALIFDQFMAGTAPLALQSFEPYLPAGKTVAAARLELFSRSRPTHTAYRNAAEYQMLRGPFNVNSTSVQAWKAMLGSMKRSKVYTLWARTVGLEERTSTGTPIPGMSLPTGGVTGGTIDPMKIDNQKTNDWNGYRELTDAELDTLAQKIVDEVRKRGPFLSLSEFVNRRIGQSSPLTLQGTLEAAIAESEINEKRNGPTNENYLQQVTLSVDDFSDTDLYNYKTKEATLGNPAAGAPGWVTQGDLMRILEPSATVRGDTFVIRAYGEALDAKGKVTARAHCEAVVQRIPDYVDPTNRPSVNAATDAAATATNKMYGRRMNIVSFRWLSTKEI